MQRSLLSSKERGRGEGEAGNSKEENLEDTKVSYQDQNIGGTARNEEDPGAAISDAGIIPPEQPPAVAQDERIAALQALLAGRETELSEARKSLETRETEFASLKAGYDEAVKAYRRLAAGSNPLFSDELITGSTIAEIDASLARAAEFIGKIRSRIEEDLKSLSIPAGAPERTASDASGLTPREKIAEGVRKQSK